MADCQARIDRLAAEAAALAAAYAAEPTLGFEYEQSPTWRAGSCSDSAVGATEAMYVPIADFGFDVGEVGSCKAFNRRGLLSEILSFYIGNSQGKDMEWAFMAHCVECDTMPGDGRSPYAVREGHNQATHYFYASTDCDGLSLLYAHDYTLGRSATSCLASPSLDDTGYIARCGDPSTGSCPKPPQAGFIVEEFLRQSGEDLSPGSSCQLPINRLVAWGATRASQCVSDFSLSRPGFLPSTVRSAKVCCTPQTATLYYYSDDGCSTPHDPNADQAELGVVFNLEACEQLDSVSTTSQLMATCSIARQECPPLEEIRGEDEVRVWVDYVDESESATDDESGIPTMEVVSAGAAIVIIFGFLWLTKSKWMSDAQQVKLNKLLHGSQESTLKERSVVAREKTEKEKIMEQYRTVSFKGGGKPNASDLKTNSEPVLPGSANLELDGKW
eukprot:COSAG02_NODE_3924_length_6038_cov_15.373127_4_plen_444_part_00